MAERISETVSTERVRVDGHAVWKDKPISGPNVDG